MPQLSEEELNKRLESLKEKVKIGDLYFHYKNPNNHYKILAIGFIEATEEPCVVYQALYGENLTWVRTEDEFLAEIEFEGKVLPRFTKLTDV